MNEKTVTTALKDDDLDAVTGGVDGSINTCVGEKITITMPDETKSQALNKESYSSLKPLARSDISVEGVRREAPDMPKLTSLLIL